MRVLNKVVIVASVGTFVDIMDMTLFQNVRVASLRDIGVPREEIFRTGVLILNFQLAGLLVGGLLFGTLADRRGRKAVLFSSIALYSLATLASACVNSVPMYAVVRFLTGVGLAGEFGAGITLIAEVLPPQTRGWGTTICAAFGLSGALCGALLATHFPWRTDYLIGGVAGLALVVLRAMTFESALFERSRKQNVRRGMLALFSTKKRTRRMLLSLAISLPLYFVLLILVPFAPELAASLVPPRSFSAAAATTCVTIGLTLGDVLNGALSQRLRSRKLPIRFSILLIGLMLLVFLILPIPTNATLYGVAFVIGLGAGYYVLFLTNAAEQFGTNVRGSATIVAPNIMRALMIPISLTLRALAESIGLRFGALLIGAMCVVLALAALQFLPETFGRDLDFDD